MNTIAYINLYRKGNTVYLQTGQSYKMLGFLNSIATDPTITAPCYWLCCDLEDKEKESRNLGITPLN